MNPSPPYAEVVVGQAVDKVLHYAVPPHLSDRLQVGQRLVVPLGRSRTTGYLVGFARESPVSPVREIQDLLDEVPLLTPDLMALARWMAGYYRAPLGQVLRAMLPGSLRAGKRRGSAADAAGEGPGGALEPELPLTPEQRRALEEILAASGRFRTLLLHGVTGSGKTEVYLQAIARLPRDAGAVVLVPEIALTPQLVERFTRRFGKRVAVLHSRLTPRERFAQWQRIAGGEVRVAVGARSAVFAPFPRLGLVVVDEEQDPSYKQEEGIRYHARDVAVVRGKLARAVVVLGSATPSLESFTHARAGKYAYAALPARIAGAALPAVRVVDLRREPPAPGGGAPPVLSRALRDAVAARLEQGQQVLLFLNRRGHATLLLCRDCGWTQRCPHCSIPLTVHQGGRHLDCHYCGFGTSPPEVCPGCRGVRIETLGLGTERIEAEVRALFPHATLARMDRDTTRRTGAYDRLIRGVAEGRIQVLVGTQMVAKGHHFPGVSLVGVVLAEAGLHLPDFRAAERTFQLLTQVAGRAGRGAVPGEVIVQTYNPEHYSLLHAQRHDYEGFYREECTYRRELGFPPFSRMARLVLRGPKAERVRALAGKLGAVLAETAGERAHRGVTVLGPAPAPLERLRGKTRWHVLLKAREAGPLQRFLDAALARFRQAHRLGSCDLVVDVDPVNLM